MPMLCASFAPNLCACWTTPFHDAPRLRPSAPQDGMGEKPSIDSKLSDGMPFNRRPLSLDWLNSGEYSIRITFGPSNSASISTTCGRNSLLRMMAAIVGCKLDAAARPRGDEGYHHVNWVEPQRLTYN